MTDGNELLEKVITSTGIGNATDGGGLLKPAQANQFIDYMFDATVLKGQIRTVRMRSDVQDIDKIGVGQRLLRRATEAVDDAVNVGVAFTKVSLTATKMRLDFELSSESLEDNLEGEALEDHVARLIATQAGQDIEDLAINGDLSKTTDPFVGALDGWGVRGRTDGSVFDATGKNIDRALFSTLIKKMPRRFMQRRGDLKFFVSSNGVQAYLDGLEAVYQSNIGAAYLEPDAVRPDGNAGFTTKAHGISVQEVPLMGEEYSGVADGTTDVWLTFPQNLVLGVRRDIVVYREFKPKKDAIEYTMFTRVGTAVEEKDAFVVGKAANVNYTA
jgi:HK97 family phage major capsid protein